MTDRTVLVTGCGSAVGRATALTFREQGWEVYATARDEDDIEELAEYGCHTDSLPVTVDREASRVVKRIDAEAGGLDAAVYLAGGGRFGALEELSVSDSQAQFEATVHGFHRLARAALPVMRAAEDGTIVAVSSALGGVPGPGAGAYSAATSALAAMVDSVRAEVDGDGVDVVAVEAAIEDRALSESETQSAAKATATDGGETESPYAWVDDLLADLGVLSGDSPFTVSPERVATEVYDAACATDPAPRYPVGGLAAGISYARLLPEGVRALAYKVVRRLP